MTRARDVGIPFDGTPGRFNSITDVGGVEVGQVTIVEGHGAMISGVGPVRTGVSAILPLGRTGVGATCPAGLYSLNGNGEMTGAHWINETGGLSGPVMLTNTHAVGDVHRGTVDWILGHRPELASQWLLPVVAETWDGYLNDVNGRHVTAAHAAQAIDAATCGPMQEGSVGGGTGMSCYGFKGGVGTASRIVEYGPETYTVGVYLQANFGGRAELRIAGVPMGDLDVPSGSDGVGGVGGVGSVIALVATDAPMIPQQCTAMARRVPLGLARTGTTGGHFSGDIFLAWSTANASALDSGFPIADPDENCYSTVRMIKWGHVDPFYVAVVQAVEEAVCNALVNNTDMVGRDGHISPALPVDQVLDRLNARGVVAGAIAAAG